MTRTAGQGLHPLLVGIRGPVGPLGELPPSAAAAAAAAAATAAAAAGGPGRLPGWYDMDRSLAPLHLTGLSRTLRDPAR